MKDRIYLSTIRKLHHKHNAWYSVKCPICGFVNDVIILKGKIVELPVETNTTCKHFGNDLLPNNEKVLVGFKFQSIEITPDISRRLVCYMERPTADEENEKIPGAFATTPKQMLALLQYQTISFDFSI